MAHDVLPLKSNKVRAGRTARIRRRGRSRFSRSTREHGGRNLSWMIWSLVNAERPVTISSGEIYPERDFKKDIVWDCINSHRWVQFVYTAQLSNHPRAVRGNLINRHSLAYWPSSTRGSDAFCRHAMCSPGIEFFTVSIWDMLRVRDEIFGEVTEISS